MDVINYTQPAPVVNTVERVITKTEQVPVLPDRPLTQAEIDMIMWQSKAAHRERIIGTVAGSIGSIGFLAVVGVIIYKIYDKCLKDYEEENANIASNLNQ